MNKKSFSAKAACIAVLLLAPSLLHAHPGHHHESGVLAGLTHPLFGLDHLLAIVAVGLLAVRFGGRSLWLLPVLFVGTMLIGSAVALRGIYLPLVEPVILSSILLLGLMIIAAARLPFAVCAVLAGAFALFHGHAHGAEMPATASGLVYCLSFAFSTALLHLGGIKAGQLLQRVSPIAWSQAAGAAVAVAGLCMILL